MQNIGMQTSVSYMHVLMCVGVILWLSPVGNFIFAIGLYLKLVKRCIIRYSVQVLGQQDDTCN